MFTELKVGQIVKSKAGRDKGSTMMVLKVEDGQIVYVVDGKRRKMQKPKLKKIKHLQPVGKYIDLEPVKDINDLDRINAYVRKNLNQIG